MVDEEFSSWYLPTASALELDNAAVIAAMQDRDLLLKLLHGLHADMLLPAHFDSHLLVHPHALVNLHSKQYGDQKDGIQTPMQSTR